MKKRSKIGKLLAVKRIKMNITQAQMAEMFAVSPQFLSMVEHGDKNMGRGFTAKIYNLDIWSAQERAEILTLYLCGCMEELDIRSGDLEGFAELMGITG